MSDNTKKKNIDHFLEGCAIGGALWLIFVFAMIFRTAYSNFFVSKLNPSTASSFYAFDYWWILAGSLLVVMALSGVIFLIIRGLKIFIKD